MPKAETSLNELLFDIRRIEENRAILTEKKIDKIYKSLVKDLNSFIAEEYVKYADKDGRLYISSLDAKNQRARFLREIANNVESFSPELRREIETLVDTTYEKTYEGMSTALKKADTAGKLATVAKDIAVNPNTLKRAINNNISKLTLPAVMEKHRNEIIYQIQKELNIGLMQGDRYETMAKRVQTVLEGNGLTKGAKGKSKNIVRTESHRNIEGGFMDCAEHIQQGLDGSGLIYAATWRTMQDKRVRPQRRTKGKHGWKFSMGDGANHMQMEGKTVKAGDLFDLGDGNKTKAPSESGVAAHDCNCRCFLEYNLMTPEEFAKATGKKVEKSKSKQAKEFGLLVDDTQTLEEKKKLWKEVQSTNITPKERLLITENYTGTTNSWTINAKLRQHPEMSIDEIYRGNSKNGNTAKCLHNVIQKNTMPKNATLTRNIGDEYADKVLGLSKKDLYVITDNFDDADVQDMLKNFIGTEITESAFMSTSANPKMNVFQEKPVRLELKVEKGHNAFITENFTESEVILDRGTKYVVEGFELDENSYQMPILKIIAKVVD